MADSAREDHEGWDFAPAGRDAADVDGWTKLLADGNFLASGSSSRAVAISSWD